MGGGISSATRRCIMLTVRLTSSAGTVGQRSLMRFINSSYPGFSLIQAVIWASN